MWGIQTPTTTQHHYLCLPPLVLPLGMTCPNLGWKANFSVCAFDLISCHLHRDVPLTFLLFFGVINYFLLAESFWRAGKHAVMLPIIKQANKQTKNNFFLAPIFPSFVYFLTLLLSNNSGKHYLHSLSLIPLLSFYLSQHYAEMALAKATGVLHVVPSNGRSQFSFYWTCQLHLTQEILLVNSFPRLPGHLTLLLSLLPHWLLLCLLWPCLIVPILCNLLTLKAPKTQFYEVFCSILISMVIAIYLLSLNAIWKLVAPKLTISNSDLFPEFQIPVSQGLFNTSTCIPIRHFTWCPKPNFLLALPNPFHMQLPDQSWWPHILLSDLCLKPWCHWSLTLHFF